MTERITLLNNMNKFFFLISISLFCSCGTVKIVKQENNSLVAISAKSSGVGSQGVGIEITLENLSTHESYVSKSLSLTSPHSIIQNIPPGRYFVRKVRVPLGNITYSNWSEDIKTFFGEIEIQPNSKYYLGNFNGKRGMGAKSILRLKIENQDIPIKLQESIEVETGWRDGAFIKLYPYQSQELLIY